VGKDDKGGRDGEEITVLAADDTGVVGGNR
jgi:hypothetical protein